eukprot:12001261-Alexandrium_andersonii.AAC.1
MSASLVGSEMCIRDSHSSVASKRRGSSGNAWRLPLSTGGSRACRRNARTVSYTHLTLPTICSV